MQAVILAAGRGRRMAPLSSVAPKPMLPVADRPLAAHVADAAVAAGADELVFVVGYGAEHVRAYFGDRYDGVPVAYAEQETQSGTADAVRAARERLDGRFAVLNGDNVFDAASVSELFAHDAAVAAHRVPDPSEYGVLSTEDGVATGIVEKPDDPPTDLANAGAYVFPESALDDLDVPASERGERELTDVLAAVVARRDVAVVATEEWRDVARPSDLLAANDRALEALEPRTEAVPPTATARGTVRVADGATVEPRARLDGPVFVADGATVGRNAVLEGPVVVGPGARIGADATVSSVVLLADAAVGADGSVRGAVVGPDCSVATGARLAGVSGETRTSAAAVVAADASLGGGLRYR
ncbi:bifunctional sugar-1-phosphate nucleotidylyltransferase/acetyltransferase [Halobacterium litoreum]|uniref:Bifunctional protein GlmU n=1 Tax=Halobacterium litoreum TaxID=2039234 RepID=A0ABD5NBG4_9EURY|nr:bifunctional sugar-1-phosphate nucleotidylyltransferase/acetyltransferase [Halobacterium litoreum]UHH14678.1 NTP transferase domain-containing protein [Halobacterium litoreum]